MQSNDFAEKYFATLTEKQIKRRKKSILNGHRRSLAADFFISKSDSKWNVSIFLASLNS